MKSYKVMNLFRLSWYKIIELYNKFRIYVSVTMEFISFSYINLLIVGGSHHVKPQYCENLKPDTEEKS